MSLKSASLPPEIACLRLGWRLLALGLAFGLLLEALHLFKLPLYVDARLRREMWTLAHAHGTLLGALNVLFGLSASRLLGQGAGLSRAAGRLRLGSILVPLGFLLGGIGNAEGDPSIFIALVPLGAGLLLAGLFPLLFSNSEEPTP